MACYNGTRRSQPSRYSSADDVVADTRGEIADTSGCSLVEQFTVQVTGEATEPLQRLE
jgi:hypothetical protein